MSRGVIWASVLIYGGFGAVFGIISAYYLRRGPQGTGFGVAAAAGALYAFGRLGMVVLKARRSRP